MDKSAGLLEVTVGELRGVEAEMQVWSCALSSFMKVYVGAAGLGSTCSLSAVRCTQQWTGSAAMQPAFSETFSFPLKLSTQHKHLVLELWRTPTFRSQFQLGEALFDLSLLTCASSSSHSSSFPIPSLSSSSLSPSSRSPAALSSSASSSSLVLLDAIPQPVTTAAWLPIRQPVPLEPRPPSSPTPRCPQDEQSDDTQAADLSHNNNPSTDEEEAGLANGEVHVVLRFTPLEAALAQFWQVAGGFFLEDREDTLDARAVSELFSILDVPAALWHGRLSELVPRPLHPRSLYALVLLLGGHARLLPFDASYELALSTLAQPPLSKGAFLLAFAGFRSPLAPRRTAAASSRPFWERQRATVLIEHRETGKVLPEKIDGWVQTALGLMYSSNTGRWVTSRLLPGMLRTMTRTQELKMTKQESRSSIAPFVRLHNIDTSEMLEPLDSFKCFNDFFIRKLKPGSRPIASVEDARVAVSPADCRFLVFPTIGQATSLWIKGKNFSLAKLLWSAADAEVFAGGSLAIARLAPQDYHRFHFPVSGTMRPVEEFQAGTGQYYTVNPLAVREDVDVYTENRRLKVIVDSPHFGRVAIICIGATLVGAIQITAKPGPVSKGDELGFFAFGGSTLIVLFEKDAIAFDHDLLVAAEMPMEKLIKMGTQVGISTKAALLDQ